MCSSVCNKSYIRQAGMEDRITLRPADFTAAPLGTGFDLVLLSYVMHLNSAEVNKRLLARAFNALEPGGTVVINDYVLQADKILPRHAALYALNMLVTTNNGGVYSLEEYDQWLSGAGFVDVRKVSLLWLPMHHTHLVGRGHALAGLMHPPDHRAQAQPVPHLPLDALPQRLPIQHLQLHEQVAAVPPGTIEAHHTGMLKLLQHPRLLGKSLSELRPRRHLRPHYFDGPDDGRIQQVLPQKHRSHPPLTQHLCQLETGQL